METSGKLQQAAAFVAGAALATLVSDAVLIGASAHHALAQGAVHHLEFLLTLIALVGVAGGMALQLGAQRAFKPASLMALGAVAALLGYGAGLAARPLGETASLLAIVVVAAAVPLAATRWPRGRR